MGRNCEVPSHVRLCTLFSVVLAALLPLCGAGEPGRPRPAVGYVRQIPLEDARTREARHHRLARRRMGPAIIVHRGAHAFAPENTLEAYAAATDYGADGCEVDLRRTQDGVLVLFHDDMLDHLTDGFGTVSQITYYGLLSLRPRFRYGTATERTRPPTFAALLTLARQRSMLLHLDVKETGLEANIARLLDAADAWDHVVSVNTSTAPGLLRDPRLKPLRYKGPGLYDSRRDVDPQAVRDQLARPGEMIMVDDPRVAAHVLGRPPYEPVPLPSGLREAFPPAVAPDPPPAAFVPTAHLHRVEARVDVTEVLKTGPDGSPEHILERAWAAQQLGYRRQRSAEVVRLLERQVRERSMHRDWMYHGLDGAMAARALGMLRSRESAPALIAAFRRIDPELAKVANPEFAANPLAWTDFRTKMYVLPALGELRCPASKAFLWEYVHLPLEKARELAPLLYEDATRALFAQELKQEEVESLLRSENAAVRGTAILECLDHPTPARRRALAAVHPWAEGLPRAKHTGRDAGAT